MLKTHLENRLMHLSWHHLKFRNPQVIIVYDFLKKSLFEIFTKYIHFQSTKIIFTLTHYIFCPSLLNFSIDSTIKNINVIAKGGQNIFLLKEQDFSIYERQKKPENVPFFFHRDKQTEWNSEHQYLGPNHFQLKWQIFVLNGTFS